jgi:hypothetical protein
VECVLVEVLLSTDLPEARVLAQLISSRLISSWDIHPAVALAVVLAVAVVGVGAILPAFRARSCWLEMRWTP